MQMNFTQRISQLNEKYFQKNEGKSDSYRINQLLCLDLFVPIMDSVRTQLNCVELH